MIIVTMVNDTETMEHTFLGLVPDMEAVDWIMTGAKKAYQAELKEVAARFFRTTVDDPFLDIAGDVCPTFYVTDVI